MRFLLTCTLLLFINLGKAQVYLGLSGGGGLSGRVGLRASVPFELEIKKHLWLYGEFVYSRHFSRDVFYEIYPEADYGQAAMDYFSVPLGLKIDMELKPFTVYGIVAAQLAYGAHIELLTLIDEEYVTEHIGFRKAMLRQWDFGLSLGGGFEKNISNRYKLFLEFRHFLGLVDINPNRNLALYNEGSVIDLGIRFLLCRQQNQAANSNE